MGVKIEIRGADETVARMQQLAQAMEQPLAPLFERISNEWVTQFQANFRNQSSPEGPWAALSPTTQKRRAKLGYGAAAPILKRKSDLLNSIQVLESGEATLSVGTRLSKASLLQFGGQTGATSAVPNAVVPARPFVSLSEQALADTMEMIEAFFLPEPADSGAASV